MNIFISNKKHTDNADILKPNMDVVKALWECGDDTLQRNANNIITSLVGKTELLGDTSTSLVYIYLGGQDSSLVFCLDDLEEVVENTADTVDEIDGKILNHAPSWSRDVARLLNEEQDHNQHLLYRRLGYTNKDIKEWATQPDPCLSMMDELFATHETKEATDKMLEALEEMSRLDAVMIVENALKNVDGIVEEEQEELVRSPPIFISYQWEHHQEIKMLKKHLRMAGFEAWMDIGQMGGGDKLLAKIDEGIRAANIIICCVSEKYAQSPNCNREVNLSVTLGKPVIPLLMENMSWPPSGFMGPICGKYPSIKFFRRGSEATRNGPFWPEEKFQELLMQLRYNVIPDYGIITKEYSGRWDPPEEMVVVKPKGKDIGHGSEATPVGTKDEQIHEKSPEVFISYQWDKQPQIKVLYQRLSGLGLTCWLDIMQMGGGDSLYDKIDKGIRGCKVVLSCVTAKYSLSDNCRREVSLADAIKKPIIPLVLEKVAWPPEGRMSMIFSNLLYINFTERKQKHWKCKEFDTLVSKLKLKVAGDKGVTHHGSRQVEHGQLPTISSCCLIL